MNDRSLAGSSLRRTPSPAWRLFPATGAAELALATTAPAAVYYINNVAGNYSSTTHGNINTPWKTISKVSSTVFAPGDTINFKRGVTWLGAGTLTINDTGTAAQPITFQSYGSGAKPKLDGNGIGNVKVRVLGGAFIVVKDFILRNTAIPAPPASRSMATAMTSPSSASTWTPSPVSAFTRRSAITSPSTAAR